MSSSSLTSRRRITKLTDRRVSRALRRLKFREDFGAVESANEAKGRARRRAMRVTGSFQLEFPRPDLRYDVAFVNKLCALELVVRDVPSIVLNVCTSVAQRQCSFSLLLSIVMLVSNARYVWSMAKERRWATEFWGVVQYYELARDFAVRSVSFLTRLLRPESEPSRHVRFTE